MRNGDEWCNCVAKEIRLPADSSTSVPQQQERLLFLRWQRDISVEEPKLDSKGTSQLNLDLVLFTALWLERWSNPSFVWSVLFLLAHEETLPCVLMILLLPLQ